MKHVWAARKQVEIYVLYLLKEKEKVAKGKEGVPVQMVDLLLAQSDPILDQFKIFFYANIDPQLAISAIEMLKEQTEVTIPEIARRVRRTLVRRLNSAIKKIERGVSAFENGKEKKAFNQFKGALKQLEKYVGELNKEKEKAVKGKKGLSAEIAYSLVTQASFVLTQVRESIGGGPLHAYPFSTG